MASIIKRKQQVNYLRQAHFPFGYDDNKKTTSQYKQIYKQHPIEQSEVTNPGRQTHINMAEYDTKYQSQFKQRYPEYPILKQQQPNKANDVNNIVLGFDHNQEKTNYHAEFVKKTKQEVKIDGEGRKGHIDFGDSLTDFTTCYKQVHGPKDGGKPEIMKPDFRKSNLTLGNDNSNFSTSNNNAYTKPANVAQQPQTRPRQHNINLGLDNVNYGSQNRQNFSHKPAVAQPVDKQVIRDFRSNHFCFGFPQGQNYQSEAQAHYNEKPIDTTQQSVGEKRASHLQLKHDGNNYFNSSYSENYQNLKGQKVQVLSKNGNATNVLIGTDKQAYITQAKQQFQTKSLEERAKANKPQNKLQLGNEPSNYQTHYNNTHINLYPSRVDNKLSANDIATMKSVNYVTGFQGNQYNLHSLDYGKRRGQTNKLPKEVVDKMRGTNIVEVDAGNFYGKTTNELQYKWKKNDDY